MLMSSKHHILNRCMLSLIEATIILELLRPIIEYGSSDLVTGHPILTMEYSPIVILSLIDALIPIKQFCLITAYPATFDGAI